MKKLFLVSVIFGSAAFALPNPSWVYCLQQGGTYETRTDAHGNQDGVCMFDKDGEKSECGGWAFFRGDCSPGECAEWSVDTRSCTTQLND